MKISRQFTYKGESRTLAEWASHLGVTTKAMQWRLRQPHLSEDEVFATDLRHNNGSNLIEYNGEVKCLAEWSRVTGICTDTIGMRLRRGWPVGEALGYVGHQYKQRYTNGGRKPKLYTYNGESKSAKQWAAALGMSPETLRKAATANREAARRDA